MVRIYQDPLKPILYINKWQICSECSSVKVIAGDNNDLCYRGKIFYYLKNSEHNNSDSHNTTIVSCNEILMREVLK